MELVMVLKYLMLSGDFVLNKTNSIIVKRLPSME